MTGQSTSPVVADDEARNDQVGAGSLTRVHAAADTGPADPRCRGSLRTAAAGSWHARLDVDQAGNLVRLVLHPEVERDEPLIRPSDR